MSITNLDSTENHQELQMSYLEAFRTLESDSTYKTELLSLLMSSDAHYGHQISRHNPMMGRYLYGEHGDVHVINLTTTMFLLKKVLNDLVSMFSESNARLLFVGSKEQLVNIIKDSAEHCGQYFVNHRWFGGTLTNWTTIQKSIKKIAVLERELSDPSLDKKLRLTKERVYHKLINSLGGIRKMSNLPDIIFVTDTNREKVAIQEANKLGIPVIALLDSNSSPLGVDYPIPCNDDSQDAVGLICQLISDAVLTGIESAFEKRQNQQKEREQNRRSYADRRSYANSGESREGSNETQNNEQHKDVNNKLETKPAARKVVKKDDNKNYSNN